MIVPAYWAESRSQHREKNRQITVRRWGWSDTGQAEAQAHADERVRDALARLIAGEALPRREPKKAYNGAHGVPIREEVVERHGTSVITRNAYGARCLNTPDVLFADIDFDTASPASTGWLAMLLVAAAVGAWWFIQSPVLGAVAAAVLAGLAFAAHRRAAHRTAARPQPEALARERIATFMAAHPLWKLAVYRTPAGLRAIALHQRFKPDDAAVASFFDAVKVDPTYRVMCLNQHCFRARVSAKPWRIGIEKHLRPRPGVWPVSSEHLPARQAWVAAYEAKAGAHAACRWLETLGQGAIDLDAKAVQELHDQLSGATSERPIA